MTLAKNELDFLSLDSLKDILLNKEELEHHAKEIAKYHRIYPEPRPLRSLVDRLDENFLKITKVYKRLKEDAKEKRPLSPASEWLLDNFYKVEEQFKDVRLNLLKDRFLKLYTIKSGLFKGYPRSYAILIDYISHTDGKLEEDSLVRFIKSYQRQKILSISEIWSISLMARIAIIKNIALICEKIVLTQDQWRKAEELAKEEPNNIILYLKEKMEYADSVSPSFVEHMLRQLRNIEAETGDVVSYLQKKLSEFDSSIKQILDEEHQEQAARKISIGNSITSLNTVSSLDWNDIFESINIVEGTLRGDPIGVYQNMDFESRDYYRINIEKLSAAIKRSETKIAKVALDLATQNFLEGARDKTAHVGYYLLDKGRKELLEHLDVKGYKRAVDKTLRYYLVPIILITVLCPLLFGIFTYLLWNKLILSVMGSIFLIIPFSDVAVHFVNYFLLKVNPPKLLPKMELKEGIGEKNRTFVVVPSLLPNEERVKELIEQLEIHYLSNKDENFYFALVGDFKDHKFQEDKKDQEIVKEGLAGIKTLNEKYGEVNRFSFFIRKRVYSEKERKWMGWERKRGALVEFNNLLLGNRNNSFIVASDYPREEFKYVMTLDADTSLPIGSAKKLVGIISHTLNEAVLDEKKNIVNEGYGIIQPRIGVSLESSNKTFFSKVFAGQGGIDPYTTASSDIYQDLFSQGIFTGKGIYNLKVFADVLHRAIPENSVLSHDLLEGSYLRAGLATDVELIDGYPSKYSSYIMRLHRWVRGDWQLLPWLFSKVKDRETKKVINPLSALSKWKILDNLRRSLVFVSLFAYFVLALTLANKGLWAFLALGVVIIIFPALLNTLEYVKVGQVQKGFGENNVKKFYGVTALWYQVVFNFIFLPYQCYMLCDAIFRTLYRLYITKNKMLEWVTAADQERNLQNNLMSYYKKMKSGVILAVLGFLLVLFVAPENLIFAVPLILLWFASPYLAYIISQEKIEDQDDITQDDRELLRGLARKTWGYYDEFANEFNNYLPPDNFQVYPPKGIAPRTSPTNIGCLLLGILIAKDFGYLTTEDTVLRFKRTLKTVSNLETWHGHLYNWYDTRTLEVLRPAYVSTVDSGNFVSNLITLKQGLINFMNDEIFGSNKLLGLRDTAILAEVYDDAKILYSYEGKEIDLKEYIRVLESLKGSLTQGLWHERYQEMVKEFMQEYKELVILVDYDDYKEYEKLRATLMDLTNGLTLKALKEKYVNIANQVIKVQKNKNDVSLELLKEKIKEKLIKIDFIENTIDELAREIDSIIESTEFKWLYNKKRNLFSIGYNVEEERLTNSYYDLLASEARTTSYIAICKGEIPNKHWFKLGRGFTMVEGSRALVSWTGTMFEYFMPNLLLKNYKDTLMDETYNSVILAQKKYGRKRNVPWGVSESGYYTFDMLLNYQYRAFGLPDLGLKRGLANDTVTSPYSCLLALSFVPKEVITNLRRFVEAGLEGTYGLYEAVDYTPARVMAHGKDKKIVKSFMAHHQGMILMALTNFIYDNILQKRFHQNPWIKAGEILLQEKIPVRAIIAKEFKEGEDYQPFYSKKTEVFVREYSGINELLPKCHILSNGRYSIMLNERGGGFSKCNEIQITRWREDPLLGGQGSYITLKRVNSEDLWSSAFEPLGEEGDSYKVKFYDYKVEYYRYDDNITTKTEITVSSEDNVEIRKLTLSNHHTEPVSIEVTSFMELVLGDHRADLAHPAFSNLFVRTEVISEYNAILASRRPREEHKKEIWGFHSLVLEGEQIGNLQYETMRGNFIGRGKTIKNAQSFHKPLYNSSGIVLDPCLSLRKIIKIPAGQSVNVTFLTGIGEDKHNTLELVKKYQDKATIVRSFELAQTRSQVEMSYLDIDRKDLEVYQEMMSAIIYQSPLKDKYQEVIEKNNRNQSFLWAYGISGDIPIVLLVIKSSDDVSVLQKLLKAHEYWTAKGLKVDLVVLNDDESSYLQPLQQMLNDVVSSSHGRHILDTPRGVFIRNARQMPKEDQTLLLAVARIVIDAGEGAIGKQIKYEYPSSNIKEKPFLKEKKLYKNEEKELKTDFYNGYGGFSEDGLEYIIKLKGEKQTPAPWINVIANKNFGFQISESGSGFTWAENSRENKLTPWSNDPVSDPPEEIIYIRDDETGEIFTTTPLPIRGNESYIVKHGMGYSIFEHISNGIAQELTVFVPQEDPIKVNLLKLKNVSKETRKLTLTYYLRPVLGVSDQITKNHLITSYNDKIDSILVKNPYNIDFPNRLVFATTSERVLSYTGDRREFIGNKDMINPCSLRYESFSNKVGAGLDPCMAIQVKIELKSLAEKEIAFTLGHVKKENDYEKMALSYRSLANCKNELKQIKRFWDEHLRKIQVQTPDKSMDLMLNGWLLYQTIACRIWARSAFYQSGGAYGYRDQLQDTMNVVYNMPEATREQILLHCAHQFVEGDVQHWWHPGVGDKGIRTRFSDDLLWLPLVTADYVLRTGDYSILNEEVHFLEDEPLGKEDERYGIPRISKEKASVYEHCIRAIEKGLKFGSNGIPLMGSGDWNDGMSTVGNKGKGESIWLGWFIHKILKDFYPLAQHMEDEDRGNRYINVAEEIARNIEKNAWDGQWYLRAFYDNGKPLGSSQNTECIIDSLGQTWAIISGGGKNQERIEKAMNSVERYLVKRDEGLIQLFTPPFDKSEQEPGYIKGYVPGVRENGGQYTHAAIWVINAYALKGNGDKAWELFNMINPINHSRTPMEASVYKVEPYVVAADVYAVHPHVGRGGWTWYTGAAGWMYRVGIEHMLGLKISGGRLKIEPCIPKEWKEYYMTYSLANTQYQITIKNPHGISKGVREMLLNGNLVDGDVSLIDDGKEHIVEVIMG